MNYYNYLKHLKTMFYVNFKILLLCFYNNLY